jgi:hypothetical protein
MELETWLELDGGSDGLPDWCRALSVSVLGLGWNTYFNQQVQIPRRFASRPLLTIYGSLKTRQKQWLYKVDSLM